MSNKLLKQNDVLKTIVVKEAITVGRLKKFLEDVADEVEVHVNGYSADSVLLSDGVTLNFSGDEGEDW